MITECQFFYAKIFCINFYFRCAVNKKKMLQTKRRKFAIMFCNNIKDSFIFVYVCKFFILSSLSKLQLLQSNFQLTFCFFFINIKFFLLLYDMLCHPLSKYLFFKILYYIYRKYKALYVQYFCNKCCVLVFYNYM